MSRFYIKVNSNVKVFLRGFAMIFLEVLKFFLIVLIAYTTYYLVGDMLDKHCEFCKHILDWINAIIIELNFQIHVVKTIFYIQWEYYKHTLELIIDVIWRGTLEDFDFMHNKKKMDGSFIYFLEALILSLFTIIGLLIAIAYYTLIERKIMAAMQRRRGPNVVGFLGFLQPIADGIKLVLKEIILPIYSNFILFICAPIFMFILSLLLWAVIPWTVSIIFFDYSYSLLYVIAISSFSVYGIIISGWASNSKYAFLGALRSTAQMISYEISLNFIFVFFVLVTSSFNLQQIVLMQERMNLWFIVPFFPLSIIFFCSMLAETNRAPYDLPEAEAELVSGYNTEYSSVAFALFFLAEYSNMLVMSCLFSVLFLGGWSCITLFEDFFCELVLPFKTTLIAFFFVWVRATLPRYRYDQLMSIGWKIFLPLTLGFLFFFIFFYFLALVLA